jgi:CubicO group peptidase (beta-lactamase class C family)
LPRDNNRNSPAKHRRLAGVSPKSRTIFLVDPKQDLVAVLMMNEGSYPIPRLFQLFRTLVYQTFAE